MAKNIQTFNLIQSNIFTVIVLEPSVFFGEVPTTQIRVASASGNPELRTFDGTDISGHILWGGMVRSDSNGFRNRMTKYNRELWSKNYHTYEFSWSPNKVVRKVDGEIYDERKLNFATLTPVLTIRLKKKNTTIITNYTI